MTGAEVSGAGTGPRRPHRQHRDEGQITLLLLGYTVILLAVVLTFAAATAVHLARHRLRTVADAAALDAAEAFDRGRYYTGVTPPAGAVLPLSSASVRAAVVTYLARAGPGAVGRGVRIGASTGSPDGATAQVVLVVSVPLPVVSHLLGDHGAVSVRVTALARARQVG